MPVRSDAGGLAFDTFAPESTGFIAADGAGVVFDDAQVNPVEGHGPKSMVEQKLNRAAPDTLAELLVIRQADAEPGLLVYLIDVVETDGPGQSPGMFNDPGIGVVLNFGDPGRGGFAAPRRECGGIFAEHTDDCGILTQTKPRLGIAGARRTQHHGAALQEASVRAVFSDQPH